MASSAFHAPPLPWRGAVWTPRGTRACATWEVDAVAGHGRREAPHAGSHFARRGGGRGDAFFEGWYLRVVLPQERRAFAFMFSVEGPGEGVVQVLGDDDVLRVRRVGKGFFGCERTFHLGHWESAEAAAGVPRVLSASTFDANVNSGYQLTGSGCRGLVKCEDGALVRWGFDYDPVLAWGERGKKTRCTATWLSHLPVFEPGVLQRIPQSVFSVAVS